MRNSWGKSYGLEGYFKVALTDTTDGVCGIYENPVLLNVKLQTDDTPLFRALREILESPNMEAIKPAEIS